jgi:hypothetical protein
MNTDATADSIEQLWEAATGKNSEYYVRQFARIREKGRIGITWNWPAFFFGLFWFFYRRMYLYAVLAFVGWIIINFVVFMGVGGLTEPASLVTIAAMMAVMGGAANALYLRQVTKRIARAAAKHPNVDDQVQNLRSRRATLPWFVMGVIIVVFGTGTLRAMVNEAKHAYRNYTLRSQVVEGFELVEGVRASMEEFRAAEGRWPRDDVELGVGYVRGEYVTSIEIDGPSLVIVYGNAADGDIVGQRVEWKAQESADGEVSWRCGYAIPVQKLRRTTARPLQRTTVSRQHLPSECRR